MQGHYVFTLRHFLRMVGTKPDLERNLLKAVVGMPNFVVLLAARHAVECGEFAHLVIARAP